MSKKGFILNKETGYFQNKGVDIMAFDDFYPEGHQSGVTIIMHGKRVASNGDIRFYRMPGQWDAVPKKCDRKLDEAGNAIATTLIFPDEARKKGFNPVEYPDIELEYNLTVKGEGGSVAVIVDLVTPLADAFAGKACFMLELFPGELFGKPWIMDGKQGIFPTQPNGPVISATESAQEILGKPYAVGKRLTINPDDEYGRLTIESDGLDLVLYDGRMRHNNGWFIVSSDIPTGVTKNAVKWTITPNVADGWLHKPVIQISQVGYHPAQPKVAVIELDKRDTRRDKLIICKITENGTEQLCTSDVTQWGSFLRYNYVKCDFSDVNQEGLYKLCYGASESSIFRIASDIYDRGVWQPVLEYFLPIQMCHMRVNDKYRVWHDLCHMDDARMAPVDHIHFDGYRQGPSTLTKYKPGDVVPELNIGGWHDAGDDDLRVESQAGETYILSLAYEAFGIDYDATAIDQDKRIVEIHQPDGKNDILQQIEHGALSVVGAYRALGRLYRGIIVNDINQYVLLGDPSAQTDNIQGNDDDRWVFTEDNPPRELTTAAHLSAVSRALKGFNDELSTQALDAARELFTVTDITKDYERPPWEKELKIDFGRVAKLHAATELYLTTGDKGYADYLLSEAKYISEAIEYTGWFIGRAEKAIGDTQFTETIRESMLTLKAHISERSAETPYGIPYRPYIWGAGWDIQRMGFQYYFLHKAYPDIFEPEMIYDSLNFVLGCHPGSNNISFASGIGAKSALIAYGWNRADWSFCPGGVISGTALIRPDFPELLDFPFLWQQTEYVLGGGSSNFMFLALATQQILEDKHSTERSAHKQRGLASK